MYKFISIYLFTYKIKVWQLIPITLVTRASKIVNKDNAKALSDIWSLEYTGIITDCYAYRNNITTALSLYDISRRVLRRIVRRKTNEYKDSMQIR